MTSREAFEAWADARDATHGGRLRNAANDFDYPLGRLLDECWQAAIQHARDVAVKVCEEIHDDYFRQARGGANTGKSDARADAADDCADAIKEALK